MQNTELQIQAAAFRLNVKRKSDKLMNYFLISYFITGLLLAFFYDTWTIAIGVGGLLLTAYYSAKILLPNSDFYQYVLSAVMAIFMAQFIYQMHGLFEMHFFAFIGSAILITYQNWKLQIPMLLLVVVHHATLGYLQNIGVDKVYFTQLDYFALQTFIIHIILAAVIFYICGLWAYNLKKNSEEHMAQHIEVARLQKEAVLFDERKRSEEALKISFEAAEKARVEAELANQAKSTFLATMSHEIRTPMNGVIGMTDLLELTELNAEQRGFTETIRSCGENLLKTINDILDFSKIESGNIELESADFDLRNCIEEVLDVFSAKAAQTGLDLVYQLDAKVPSQIIGDSLRLRQVLMNLVGNAVKFTMHGEIFVGVRLKETFKDGSVELAFQVKDTGIGVSAENLGRLFKAFSQADSSTTRKYGGTGLGLVICEKLIHLMGGEINVESELHKGTVFSFTIRTSVSDQPSRTYVHNNLSNITKRKILVVDDNETNLTIIKNQLEQWHQMPVLSESANQALSLLRYDSAFDLIITDMHMPVMDGLEFSLMVRQFYPHIPIILLSSLGDEVYKNYPDLFSAILVKPVRQHVLQSHVLNQLKQISTTIKDVPAATPLSVSNDKEDANGLYILVAEDNPTNQKVAVKILNKLGYNPDVAENGDIALQMLKGKKYDIIFMDVQMPVKDGLETTRMIRLQKGVQPVIIAMTANAIQGDKQICLDAGMDDYISKPFRLEELTKIIEKWAMQLKVDEAY